MFLRYEAETRNNQDTPNLSRKGDQQESTAFEDTGAVRDQENARLFDDESSLSNGNCKEEF